MMSITTKEDIEYQKEKLIVFFSELKSKLERRISIKELRPKLIEDNSSFFIGDFDFVISKNEFSTLLDTVYNLCKEDGINFTLSQSSKNKKLFYFFIKDLEECSLAIEFWTSIEYTFNGSKKKFDGHNVLKEINKDINKESVILSSIYLTHLHHKNKDITTEENKFRFEQFSNQLLRNKDSKHFNDIYESLKKIRNKQLSLKETNKIAVDILRGYNIKGKRLFLSRVNNIGRRIWLKLFYLNRIIPVVGPDGVGKGVVSKNGIPEKSNWVAFRFKSLYRVPYIYKLGLKLLRNNKNEPMNQLDEKIPYYIFFMSFLTIRFLAILKFKNKILLDRYFIDYYATPIRYLANNQKPKNVNFYKLLLFLTPTPRNMVFMACKDSSLIERKNELSNASVSFLQNLNCEFIVKKRVPRILFISTENTVDTSVKTMNSYLKQL